MESAANEAPVEVSAVNEVVMVPRVGEAWPGQGGFYAGIVRGENGAPNYHLIVGPELDSEATWDSAMSWANGLNVEGHNDFSLPTRREQRFLFCNAKDLFQPYYYWSSEQHADHSFSAWVQDFFNGYQDYYGKDDEYRARVVRRLAI